MQIRKQLQIQCIHDCSTISGNFSSAMSSGRPLPPVMFLGYIPSQFFSPISFHLFLFQAHSFLGHTMNIHISSILLCGITDLFVSSWPTQAKSRELIFPRQKIHLDAYLNKTMIFLAINYVILLTQKDYFQFLFL